MARNAARTELRATTEQLDRQVAISTNIYGLSTRLVSQLERVEAEKSKELSRLANECQVLRATSESLETELAKLHTLLANGEQTLRRQQEEIQRLRSERDAHAASLASRDERICRMERERDAITSEKNAEIARLVSERDAYRRTTPEASEPDTSHTEAIIQRLEAERDAIAAQANAEIAQLRQERDDSVHKLDVMTHTFLPRVIQTFTRKFETNVDNVCRLDAKYARHARETEAKSAALNREKDELIRSLNQQCDSFKAMANALQDRSIGANPFKIIDALDGDEPTIDEVADQLQSSSLD